MIYVNVNYENSSISIISYEILSGKKAEIYNNFCNKVKNNFLGSVWNKQTLFCLSDLINKTNEELKVSKEDLEITNNIFDFI